MKIENLLMVTGFAFGIYIVGKRYGFSVEGQKAATQYEVAQQLRHGARTERAKKVALTTAKTIVMLTAAGI